MLVQPNPQEAYRRVDFDARVAAARPGELVAVCFEQLSLALGSAIRALAALTALELGVDRQAPGAGPLLQFYAGVRRTVLDSVPQFDGPRLAALRRDVDEVGQALSKAQ